jgi:hypothetical protein
VLDKKGEPGTPGANKWQTRFVVLSNGELTYFRTQSGASRSGSPTAWVRGAPTATHLHAPLPPPL